MLEEMKGSMKFQLKTQDIILTLAYTAIYFLIIAVSAMLTVFLIPGYSFIFIPILIALLAGSVYYLLALKVPKFGAITLMAGVIGLFYLISGRYPLAILLSILFGLLADWIAQKGNYRDSKLLFISYLVFTFSNIGPVLPIFVFQSSYTDHIEGTGQSVSQVQRVFSSINFTSALIVLLALVIAGIIGAWIGRTLINKHFVQDEASGK
mgnify:FL=1